MKRCYEAWSGEHLGTADVEKIAGLDFERGGRKE